MPMFRVEEYSNCWTDWDNETDSQLDNEVLVRRYECRYYQVNSVPDNWETMTLDEQGQYLWDNGSVALFYDEDTGDDTALQERVISVKGVQE